MLNLRTDMTKTKSEFITGNEVSFRALVAAGAEMMCGYPITPSTEIMTYWAKYACQNKNKIFLQTEDEMSAGFGTIGGILAGKKAFTVTAGPGTVLMQDAISMAEAMRIPMVGVIVQRGIPSTGTVIYSQQEFNTITFTGGEGLRVIYSPSNLSDLYYFIIKAFITAWKYRFPTFVLSDGYLGKMKARVELKKPKDLGLEQVKPKSFILSGKKEIAHLRNCYPIEDELYQVLIEYQKDFDAVKPLITEYEEYHSINCEVLIVAHGNVSGAAKVAINVLKKEGIKAGLFRPITLWPFPEKEIKEAVKHTSKILVCESSLGQLERLVKMSLYGNNISISLFTKPALGITPEEIYEKVKAII